MIFCLSGWAIYTHSANVAKREATQERFDEKLARIEVLKAAPAYQRLIEHGSEICPEQADETIWVCGATIRMPRNNFRHVTARPRCSSTEEPRYVGRFSLPEITSAEPETEGRQVRVHIPRFGAVGEGRYTSHASWWFYNADLPAFAPCDVHDGRDCANIWILGERELVSEENYFYRAIPDILQTERPAPEDLAFENHPMMVDVFLDLDGQPVEHIVGHPSRDGRHFCQFRVQHPEEGYVVGIRIDCNEVQDWRRVLRGILAELSNRTIAVEPDALCHVPPAHARITPQAHWTSIDQHQAMHDWAVERDAQ